MSTPSTAPELSAAEVGLYQLATLLGAVTQVTDPDEPPDFGTTLDDVRALLPDVVIQPDPAGGDPSPPGGYDRGRITEGHVKGWIRDITAVTAAQLPGLSRLRPGSGTQVTFQRAAASIVATGVASYLSAARYPEREGQGVDSYAQTLWERYTAQLATLAAALTAVVDGGGVDVQPPPAGGSFGRGGAAGSFPPPMFPDGMVW